MGAALRRGLSALLCTASLLAVGCAQLQPPGDGPPSGAADESLVPAVAAIPVPAAPSLLPDRVAELPAAPASAAGIAAAVAPAPAMPPLPRGRLDPEKDAARSSLWDRIRGNWDIADLDGDRVGRWEQFYARQPDYVQRMMVRGSRYLFHIVEEVERRQLPAELALLPFIESAFNPQAMSHARASGMWQFMPATGKDFELRQNVFRDDRRDVLASTRAALDYLQRLHGLFGDWHLALAAYNWGQGNVSRAIERNRRAGLPTDYLSLRMPEETRDYVPKLQAVKNIVVDATRLGLTLPPVENHPFFLSVPIERDIDVTVAARLAGMSVDDFKDLNPQMNQPVILAAGVPQVLLPYDNANQFVRELARMQGPLATWTAWVAPRTLQPAEAARLVGMSEAQLRAVNRIPARMLVKTGSTLLVPRGAGATADVTEHVADHATMMLTPESRPLRRVSFKAGKGGLTVAAVAQRYRVSAAQVAQWNGVAVNGRFKAGQPVVVMLAPKAVSRKAAPAAGAARKRAGKATATPRKAAAAPARARAGQTGPR